MNKKEYLDEIEQKKLVDIYERKNVLKSIGGALKSGISAVGKKVLPFVLSVPLFLGAAFGFAGCDTQDVVKEEPGITVPGGDIGEEPGTPGIEEPGKEESGTDEPGKEEPGTDDPTNPGGSTEEPGKEEPGTEEPENPGGSTEEPTNPGETPEEPEEPDVQEPEQDISNLVVYVDEEGESHVNMPVLQEATFDYMRETVINNTSIFNRKTDYETDDILFSNYNSTDEKLTMMWGGINTDSGSKYGYTILDIPVSFDAEDISSEDKGISIDYYKKNILGNLQVYNFESQNFEPTLIDQAPSMTEKDQKIMDGLKTIASDNNRVDLNNLCLFFITDVSSATPGQDLGICMGYRTYGIEKTGNQLVLRGFSIYSSMQFGVQSEELVQHESNIINYANGGADWIGVAGDNKTVLLTMEDFYTPSNEVVETKTVNYVLPTKKEETEKTL